MPLQEHAKSLGIEFRPLNPVFGAEVIGVDLSQPLPDSTKALLQVQTQFSQGPQTNAFEYFMLARVTSYHPLQM